nr:hypothetical protein KV8917_350040 [Klebsiella variicola]
MYIVTKFHIQPHTLTVALATALTTCSTDSAKAFRP